MLEISLARVLSVSFFQSFAYITLSLAVLGLGIGAALSTRTHKHSSVFVWVCCAALGALVLSALVAFVGVNARVLLLVMSTVPFVFVGVALTLVFRAAPSRSSWLYWFDLLGAAAGALLVTPVLHVVGGFNGLLVAAFLLAVAAALFARASSTGVLVRWGLCGLSVAVLGLSVLTQFSPAASVLFSASKPVQAQLNAGATTVKRNWDAFARTDLLQTPDGAYYLYVDGASGSLIPNLHTPERWQQDIGAFPFIADTPESVFLLGSGGGLDVALAKLHGVTTITAAELNNSSLVFTRALAPELGDVYDADVTVVVDEGRRALRQQQRLFDLIFLSQVITQTSEARGYALGEHSVYTVEALREYLRFLSPDGQIAMKLYDELTLSRAFLTALAVLREQTGSEQLAARHLVVLLDTRVTPAIPLLLIRKHPVSRDEAIRLARLAETRGLSFVFIPELYATPPLDGLLDGSTRSADILALQPDVSLQPSSDNKPFFYQFETGVPRALRPLVWLLGGMLVALLSMYAVRVSSLTVIPRFCLPVVALLGVGFMLIEIALLQSTRLLLGHPTLSMSVILAALLFFGGVGSYFTAFVPVQRAPQRMLITSAGVALVWVVWLLAWPALSHVVRSSALWVQLLVSITSIAPLAALMGTLFPLTLRYMSVTTSPEQGVYVPSRIAYAWMTNGFFSVIGSVSATLLALSVGFMAVSFAGGMSYVLVALLCALLLKNTR